jgi:hypothetical protein
MREHVLARQEHALQVDVVDPVPALLGDLDRPADFDVSTLLCSTWCEPEQTN